MCCRYYTDEDPELRPIVEEMNRSTLSEEFRRRNAVIRTHGEVRPTEVSPALASARTGRRAVFPMQWGYRGKTLIINARAESAAEKPTFRESWRMHRCILPASGYYEWEHRTDTQGTRKTGEKYRFSAPGNGLIWLCGLYRMEEGLPHYVILTREAEEHIRMIHDRMPLILPGSLAVEWIRPGGNPEELIREARTDILFEKEA